MSKVPMPAPSAEITKVGNITVFDLTEYGKISGLSVGQTFITTGQAEVYATAKVREALEQAARIVELASQHHHVECWSSLEKQAAEIRALKPE